MRQNEANQPSSQYFRIFKILQLCHFTTINNNTTVQPPLPPLSPPQPPQPQNSNPSTPQNKVEVDTC